jgi:hypothetical protein
MKGPIRLAHFMFVFGLILMGSGESRTIDPLWPMLGYQILGLILFLSGFRIMQGAKRRR